MSEGEPIKIETMLWGLFVAGGMAALLLPVLIVLVNLAPALGLIQPSAFDYQHMLSLVRNPITKIYLFVVIGGSLFHGMHRFRHTLCEWGFKSWSELVAVICYGVAFSGTGLAAYILLISF